MEEIAKTLAQEDPAFKCNEDKVDVMFGEAVNFLFEFSYMSSMSASFGYALEKVFNCGDIGTRWACRILVALNTPSRNDGAISELNGTTDIHLFGTWPHENDAMHNHIEQHLHPVKDIPTLQAIKSMIRDRHPLGFLKLYEMHSLFDNHRGLKPIVDAISTSDGFEAVKHAVVDIRAAMTSTMTSTTDPTEKSRRVKAAIATIDKKSKFGKRYLAPKKYHKECAESLTSLKDAVVNSDEVKPLIVVEYESKSQLKPRDLKRHFPSNSEIYPMYNYDGTLAGEVYVYDYKSKTIRILLVPSGHIIRGSHAGVKARMSVGKSFVTIMSHLEEARVVPTSAFERYRDIFYAQVIEMGGLGKKGEVVDDELVMASVHKARRAALPDDLGSGNPILTGVPGLSQLISPDTGIDEQGHSFSS